MFLRPLRSGKSLQLLVSLLEYDYDVAFAPMPEQLERIKADAIE